MTQENTQHRYLLLIFWVRLARRRKPADESGGNGSYYIKRISFHANCRTGETSGIHYGKTWTCHYLRHGIPARIGSKREPRKTGAFAFPVY